MLSKNEWLAFAVILAFITVLIALRVVMDSGAPVRNGVPLVTPDVETTVLTSPLNHNGDVDYGMAVNAMSAKGISPENNSVIKYIEAFGPGDLNTDRFDEIFADLGMDPLPIEGNYFESVYQWAERKNASGESKTSIDSETFDQQYTYASNQPWSAKQFPQLAQWLAANEFKLEIAREGISRNQYYEPIESVYWSSGMFVTMRRLARTLSASAMRHLEAGEIEKCIGELESICKVSQQLDQGPTLVSELVAMSIFSMAINLGERACVYEKLEVRDLELLLAMVQGLSPPVSLAKKLDVTERFIVLKSATDFGRAGQSDVDAFFPDTPIFKRHVDWNAVLRTVNAEVDTLVDLAEIENFEDFETDANENEQRLAASADLSLIHI